METPVVYTDWQPGAIKIPDMNNSQEEFIRWLLNYIDERGWNMKEACLRARVASNTISEAVNKNRHIGFKATIAFARAFQIPIERLLVLARHIPPSDEPEERALPELMGLYHEIIKWPMDIQHLVWRAWVGAAASVGEATGQRALQLPLPPGVSAEVFDKLGHISATIDVLRGILGKEAFSTYVRGDVATTLREAGMEHEAVEFFIQNLIGQEDQGS